MLTAAHCVDFSNDNQSAIANSEVFNARSNESRIFVYVGIHHTADQSIHNAYLVKKIIMVRFNDILSIHLI